ncbi:MAG: lamin tail domain-containing protein, partial [Planctomycetota bacterium]|nr:lamin tail domain-containing protein [Planctomycetota bacterium]
MLRRASLAGLLSLFWGAPVARLPAQEIVISEIQYHPHGNDHGDEFLELENRGDSAVDLADWFLADGVFFRFAAGTVLAPGEAIVVSPDRERTVERYGLDPARVVGNWVGRLENSGEVLHLIDADGNSAFRVRYRDRGGWPQRPDGDGASLELLPGFWDPHLPGAWRASPRILGSPGEPTTSLDAAVDGGRDVSPRGAVWSYFEGTEEPSPDDPLGWTRTEFDDASWRTGEEPFGFGEAGLGTELTSMWGRNVTLYARQVFQLPRAELDLLESGMAEIAIRVTFDDGFALYLNGQERLRENLAGNRGEPIPFDQGAERAESSSRTLVLSGAGSGLQAGPNVIALQGVNRRAFSGDFLLGATVRLDREFTEEAALLINEVKPAGATAGFVEILNPDSRPRALSGYRLTDNPYGSDAYVFPGGSEVAAGGFLVVAADALPFALSVEERRILLVRPGGGFEDVFRGNPGNSERSAARVPDGAGRRFSTPTPTPGEPNRFFPDERVVVNEIHYH